MFEYLFGPVAIAAVQAFFGPDWLLPFRALTYLGTSVAVLPMLTLAFWLGGRALAYQLAGVGSLAAAVNVVIWWLVVLPRPSYPEIQVHVVVSAPSFPSGHVVIATALWGLLAFRRKIPVLLFLLVVVVEMLSRLYLGAHHLGDVLAGFAVGLGAILVFVVLWCRLADWVARLPYALVLALGCIFLGLTVLAIPFLPLDAELEIWRAVGVSIGGVIAFLLERGLVRYSVAEVLPGDRVVGACLGLFGVTIAIVLSAVGSHIYLSPPLAALAMAFGALWGLLVAPAIYRVAVLVLDARAA